MTTPHSTNGKRVPAGAKQHVTAGPYSPVLEIQADTLVVISGQVAIDFEGKTIGSNIEDQTRATLENCRHALQVAGCTFEDVFKVNAFMANLDDWDHFNAVYMEAMPEPRPVRTTIGAKLLEDFLIELEMWAVKPS